LEEAPKAELGKGKGLTRIAKSGFVWYQKKLAEFERSGSAEKSANIGFKLLF